MVGAIPLPHRTPVATQAPRTLGTDPSVEVAPNIWAANAPITRTAPDGDWLDLNLPVRLDTLNHTGGRSYSVGLQALDNLPDGRAGVTVAARDSDDGGDGSSLGTGRHVDVEHRRGLRRHGAVPGGAAGRLSCCPNPRAATGGASSRSSWETYRPVSRTA